MINHCKNKKRTKVFIAMAVVGGFIVAFLIIMPNRAPAQQVKFSEEWLKCQENKDCVVTEGLCDWACINVSSVEEAEQKFFQKIKPVIECLDRGYYKKPRPQAVCSQNKCSCKKQND